MLRKYLIVPAVTLLSVIFSISFAKAASPQKEAVKYVANFNYTPDSQAAPGSAGVTIVVGSVNYNYQTGSKTPWFNFAQFANLSSATKQDLSELLTAKGFSVRGPFDSYDLVPFSDKKASDLYLLSTIEILTAYKDVKEVGTLDNKWLMTGNFEVTGKIILEAREVITGELMWSKRIPLTKFEFPYKVREAKIDYNLIMNYGSIMDDVAKGIEKQYPEFMATVAKLIDPEEMRIIKKLCQELRSKKGY